MSTATVLDRAAAADRRVPLTPPSHELYNKRQLVERHPTLLSPAKVAWALRHRRGNGLGDAVFETRSGELVVHEPTFLAWYLGLAGRAKPRARRRKQRHQGAS